MPQGTTITLGTLIADGNIEVVPQDETYTFSDIWLEKTASGVVDNPKYSKTTTIDSNFANNKDTVTVTPEYSRTTTVIVTDGDKPAKTGYYKLLFKAGDFGNFGTDNDTAKTVYVLQDAGLSLKDLYEYQTEGRPDSKIPVVTPKTGYVFKTWNNGTDNIDVTTDTNVIAGDATYTAKYLPEIKNVTQSGWNITANIDKGFVPDDNNSEISVTISDPTSPNGEKKINIPSTNITIDPNGKITITIPEDEIPNLDGKPINVVITDKGDPTITEKGTTTANYSADITVKFTSDAVDFKNGDPAKATEKTATIKYGAKIADFPTISNADVNGTKYYISKYTVPAELLAPNANNKLTQDELDDLMIKPSTNSITIPVVFNKYHKVTFVAEANKVTFAPTDKTEIYILEGGKLKAGQEENEAQATEKSVPTPSVTNKVYVLDGWKDNKTPANEYKDEETGEIAVDKIKEVTIDAPITFTAVAKAISFVPIEDGDIVPAGFVTITFESGNNGTFDDFKDEPNKKVATKFAVDPNSNVKIGDLITSGNIKVKPNTTYTFNNDEWVKKGNENTTTPAEIYNNNTVINSNFENGATDVTLVPKYGRTQGEKESDGEEDEKGYTTVIFRAGSHGTLKSVDTTTQPQKYVDSRTLKLLSDTTSKWKIQDLEVKLPEVNVNTDWKHTGWKKLVPKPEVNHVVFAGDQTEIDEKHIFEAKYLPNLGTPTQDGWNIDVALPGDFTTTDENNITITLVDEDGNPINGPDGQPITGTVVTDDDGNKKIKVNVPTDNIPSLDGKKVGIKISENDPGNNNPPSVTTDPIPYDGNVIVKFTTTISTFTDGTNIQNTEKEVKVPYGSKLGNNLPNITEDSVDGNTKYKIRDYDFGKAKPLTPDEIVDEVIAPNSKTLVIPVNVNEYVKVTFEVDSSLKDKVELSKDKVEPSKDITYYVTKGSTLDNAEEINLPDKMLEVPTATLKAGAEKLEFSHWSIKGDEKTKLQTGEIYEYEIQKPTTFVWNGNGDNIPQGYGTIYVVHKTIDGELLRPEREIVKENVSFGEEVEISLDRSEDKTPYQLIRILINGKAYDFDDATDVIPVNVDREEITVEYIYNDLRANKVVVKYVDENGNSIPNMNDVTISENLQLGDPYNAQDYIVDIAGYKYVDLAPNSAPIKGIFAGENLVILLEYHKDIEPEKPIEIDENQDDMDYSTGIEFGKLPSPKGAIKQEAKVLRWGRYMIGDHLSNFNPNQSLTRAEAAQIIYNMVREDGNLPEGKIVNLYGDVNKNDWFYEAVTSMTEKGIFEGYKNNFMPEKALTKAEWITVLIRLRKEELAKGGKNWYDPYVNRANEIGWLSIYDKDVDYNTEIIRAEVANVTNKALGRTSDKLYIRDNVNNFKTFGDVKPSDWFYEDVVNATTSYYFDEFDGKWIDHEREDKTLYNNKVLDFDNQKFEVIKESK